VAESLALACSASRSGEPTSRPARKFQHLWNCRTTPDHARTRRATHQRPRDAWRPRLAVSGRTHHEGSSGRDQPPRSPASATWAPPEPTSGWTRSWRRWPTAS